MSGNTAAAPGAGSAIAANGPGAAHDYLSGREIAALPVGGPGLAPDPGGFVPAGGLPSGGFVPAITSAVPEPGAGLMLLGGLGLPATPVKGAAPRQSSVTSVR